MNKSLNIVQGMFIALFLFGIQLNVSAQIVAFPGAEGYGRFASGGRGDGKTAYVVAVTTLEDDMDNPPVGSMRWAVKQGKESITHPILGKITFDRPLTVVFRVGGVINLKGDLRVNRKDLTIAGQTAPGDGICFRGGTVNFSGCQNLIVRYIRSRPGDELGLETSAFRIENGGNFIIDHCSFSWAIEETTHFSSDTSLTIQWCIVSESFYETFHKKGARGYGAQWGGQYATYHHNLMAHHNSRTPRINGSNENDVFALVDYRNNVNYNWAKRNSFYGGEWMKTNGLGFAKTNMVNNYFVPGPSTPGDLYYAQPGQGDVGDAQWFLEGNVMVGSSAKTNDNWLGILTSAIGSIDKIRQDKVAVRSDGVLEAYDQYTQTSNDAYLSVLENVGATLPKRDVIDTRVIAELKGEVPVVRYAYTDSAGKTSPAKGLSSGIIDTQRNLVSQADRDAGKTAWDVYESTPSDQAPLDSDNDGMPDEWETAKGLNPNDGDDFKLLTPSGYSNLEVYLIELTGEEIPTSSEKVFNDASAFRLYPNPVKNMLFLENDKALVRVEVYDFLGKLVKAISTSIGNTAMLETNDLDKGIYLVKAINVDQKVYIQKFIKE